MSMFDPERILGVLHEHDLDLTFTPSGFPGGYDQFLSNAVRLSLVDMADTAVASLDDIITSKEAAGRSKDVAALPYLRALRREIGEAT